MSASDGASDGSVFWEIPNRWRKPGERSAMRWIEIDAEGYIPREVELDDELQPLDITRPGEYGVWNDTPNPPAPPGTSQFDALWGDLGSEISREDFEAIYGRADAQLPLKGTGCAVANALVVLSATVTLVVPLPLFLG
jgi:hypothetical protein